MPRYALGRFVGIALIVLLLLGRTAPTSAAGGLGPTPPHCFPNVPGIRSCISNRFYEFWQQNGGLAVFGYPVTNAFPARTPEGIFTVQYFERQRFEFHPTQPRPYDVLLGRLGDERLQQIGSSWSALPRETGPQAGCLWFLQTGHNVCDQGATGGFKTYWQTHGLQDPALNAGQRSLALFGYPLTTPRLERNSSGDQVLTQWFERARLEWHPTNPAPFKTLQGRLGAEFLAAAGTAGPVNIYLIAIEDHGKGGKQIGCGDSVVPVVAAIAPTHAPLSAALEELLAIKTPYYGESGLYNALYRSNLHVDRVSIAAGMATIYLTGSLALGGECDDPRVEAQLAETALQFPSVQGVQIFLNGRLLRLGGRG